MCLGNGHIKVSMPHAVSDFAIQCFRQALYLSDVSSLDTNIKHVGWFQGEADVYVECTHLRC